MKPWKTLEEGMADLDILERYALGKAQPDPQRARMVVAEFRRHGTPRVPNHRFKPSNPKGSTP